MHAQTGIVNQLSYPRKRPLWRWAWGNAVQFDPKIDLGHVLTLGTVIVLATVYIVSNQGTARIAADAAKQAGDNVASLRIDMNEQFRQVRADIANLPNVQAELAQLEKREDQIDARVDAQSKRMELIEREVIQARADLDNVIRASTPLKH